ncbi:carnitine acetyltransferase [Suhomyces tanzawaensis NRRL Y-17324]|uniref:Carnitine acetyltransferase n=1 Tax=Suhomyces tanzawaensis NRRL Y-17324 TaxID=984487 RepID=A0A1E4SNR7_9ASCO|nr:carnitine acetyltransferase [Suhomyces tanzawaensis NRRL Y-17324]ODV81067.1 carnitine acetyltransferase [Suhomyces tanzawaensis NRRL Y-17324]
MSQYTYKHEEGLPQLPVPLLASTAQQMLIALKPLLSTEEYSELHQESSAFVTDEIINLIQSHLVAASQKPSNSCYLNSINDETNPGIYGELRGNILPRNPYLVLEEDPYSKTVNPPNQCERAASLINSSLKFIVSLRNGTLKPDLTPKNSNPLTMNCYKNLFGTTRVPSSRPLESNITIKKYKDVNDSRHIVIITNNQYYKLEVLTPNDDSEKSKHKIWFNDNELSLLLEGILEQSLKIGQIESINNSIGSITTQSLKEWKSARMELIKTNKQTLELIDNALFVVVLDPNSPETDQDKTSVISHGTSKLLPHSTMQIGSCTSRWYDKLQLIVTQNSCVGIVWESTSMDSTAILRFVSDIYTDLILKLAKNINGSEYTLFDDSITFVSSREIEKPDVSELKFVKTPELQNLIHLSETRLADIINQHEFKVLKLKLDSHLVAKFDISIDSMLQICFQIANYSLYGKMVNTLEPITTRKFKDSRTELIAIQSDQIFRMVKLFLTQSNDQEKWDSFKQCCIDHHKQYIDAMHGKGFERHLSTLLEVAKNPNTVEYLNELNSDLKPIPLLAKIEVPLLSNPLIEKLLTPEILISNCGNQALHLFGISPATDQGFGIGYIIHSDKVIITVSSKFRQTERFLNTFKRVVGELKSIIKKKSNFLMSINDSETRKVEMKRLRIEHELDKVENVPSKRYPIKLVTDRHDEKADLALGADYGVMKNRSNSIESAGSGSGEYDLLGGYGYFDFGELDLRSNIISRNESFLNSHSNLHSNLGSRLGSRNHSLTHLNKVTDDLKEKMSISEKIRERLGGDRLGSLESVSEDPPQLPKRDKKSIGRELDTSDFR